MTTELTALAALTLWTLVLIYIPATGRILHAGVSWALGNRDTPRPEFPAWVGRADRALANHLENWPLFAGAVVLVHLSGKADATSALVAPLAAGARVAHGLLYVAGVKHARTLAHGVGLAATLILWSRLL